MKIFKKILSWKNFFDLIRQCIYLQLEKPSGSKIESPIHKRLAIDFLEGMAKRTPPVLIGIKLFCAHTEFSNYLLDNKQLK